MVITLDEDLGEDMKVSMWFCIEYVNCTLVRFEREDGVELYSTYLISEIKLEYDAERGCMDPYYQLPSEVNESRFNPDRPDRNKVCPTADDTSNRDCEDFLA